MYNNYYPGGGEHDIVETFNSERDGMIWISLNIKKIEGYYKYNDNRFDYCYLYDTVSRKRIRPDLSDD